MGGPRRRSAHVTPISAASAQSLAAVQVEDIHCGTYPVELVSPWCAMDWSVRGVPWIVLAHEAMALH